MEPTLFSRLKEPVQVYMSELAQMCHDRWKFKKEASHQTVTMKWPSHWLLRISNSVRDLLLEPFGNELCTSCFTPSSENSYFRRKHSERAVSSLWLAPCLPLPLQEKHETLVSLLFPSLLSLTCSNKFRLFPWLIVSFPPPPPKPLFPLLVVLFEASKGGQKARHMSGRNFQRSTL